MDGDLGNHVTGTGPRATGAGGLPPDQLPPAPPRFVGRTAELALLTDLLDRGRAPLMVCVAGAAGIGKTALVLHWSRSHADRFPDGRLYADLRGGDPRGPLDPAVAVRGFLDAFGVPKERIPADVAAQAALYRDVVAGKRLLVVLDDARDHEQVRPLLPGGPTAAALVTGRERLDGLADGRARHLALGLPSAAEARELLAAHLGERRARAADRLVERCARLPIALVVAARAAARGSDGPVAPAGGGPGAGPRAVFHSSYRALPGPAARLFRLLGLHPGAEVGVPAAASLAGVAPAVARDLLRELTGAALLEERGPGRYRFHDLLREHAAERVAAEEPEGDRRAAVGRLLDCCLHTAFRGERLLRPHRDAIALDPPAPGAVVADLPDRHRARAWFAAEHRNLAAALDLAVRWGFTGHAWRLPWALSSYLGRSGRWRDWEQAQLVALDAARRQGDPAWEAVALRALGRAYTAGGRYERAVDVLRQALWLPADAGGEAHTHQALSQAYERWGMLPEAHAHARRAVELTERTGHRLRHARASNQLGRVLTGLGRHEGALHHCRRAAAVLAEVGDEAALADAAEGLARAHHRLGRCAEAVRLHLLALAVYRRSEDLWSVGDTLCRLGDAHAALGDAEAARATWHDALAVLTGIDHPAADAVRAKLV